MVRQVTKLQKEIEEMKDRLEEHERKVGTCLLSVVTSSNAVVTIVSPYLYSPSSGKLIIGAHNRTTQDHNDQT